MLFLKKLKKISIQKKKDTNIDVFKPKFTKENFSLLLISFD